MRSLKLASLAIACALLSACHDDELTVRDKEYVLLDVNPPSQFYITVRDVETGIVYRDKYVSKHCSVWTKAIVGNTYTFPEHTTRNSERDAVVRPYVNGFCEHLKSIS